MGKSNNNISSSPEGMPRPSLLASGAPASHHNILDAMTSQATPPPKPSNKTRWFAWLLLPLLAATAWGVSTQLQTPPVTRPVALSPPPSAVAPTVAQALPTTSATAAISKTATATNPFNTLDASAGGSQQPAVTEMAQKPTAFDMQAALNAPSSDQPAPAKKMAPKAAVKPGATQPAEITAPAPKVKAAKTPPPTDKKIAIKAATSKQAVNTKPATPEKPQSPDPDVELLSAIMKHLGNEGAPAPQTRSSQTIAQLVKSCHRKDAIEAMLCQRRICEGSWGKAQACPQSLAPKPANGSTAKAPP